MAAKNLLGLPWRVALALQDDGWIIRNAIVWHKPNAMPESVRDRMNCRYELLFLLVKSRYYWFDLDPIRIPHATAPAAPGCMPARRHRHTAAIRHAGHGAASRRRQTQRRPPRQQSIGRDQAGRRPLAEIRPARARSQQSPKAQA